jgi:hypothetical protein
VTTKNTGKYNSIGGKKEKKTCVRIKRVKSDSYLNYGQSCKTYMELYVDTPPQKKIPINSFVLCKCNMGWEY